jgi:hypothetical protein
MSLSHPVIEYDKSSWTSIIYSETNSGCLKILNAFLNIAKA